MTKLSRFNSEFFPSFLSHTPTTPSGPAQIAKRAKLVPAPFCHSGFTANRREEPGASLLVLFLSSLLPGGLAEGNEAILPQREQELALGGLSRDEEAGKRQGKGEKERFSTSSAQLAT